MKKVILFGGTGHLGKKIAEELQRQNYKLLAVVRNKTKAEVMNQAGIAYRIADVTKPSSLHSVCNDFDIVVSSLGKSVSPNDKSKPSFKDIDLDANSAILNEAVKSGVKKFVYVSALGAEKYLQLDYFNTHQQFSERLIQSGIDYSIIKPPALFSAFLDLMEMAKKGRLMTIGKGDKLTNPIYEGDLATVCINSINQSNVIIEAGGKEVLSRKEINELIQRLVNPSKKVRAVPLGLIKTFLPLIKLASKNMYDKMAFFTTVMEEDVLAPKVGEMRLEEYIRMQLQQ